MAGLVIGFSIPKYTVTVKLAPEVQGGKPSLGGLGSLASMAGINMGSMNSADAMSPELYPDIVQSVPFMTELFDVEVRTARDERRMPVSGMSRRAALTTVERRRRSAVQGAGMVHRAVPRGGRRTPRNGRDGPSA